MSNIASLHRPADIPAESPPVAMVKEAQTIHLFRQDRDVGIQACVGLYGLGEGARESLANLDNGHHLLNIGNRREIHVEHVRSQWETALTDTDAAMNLTGPVARP